MASTLPMVIAPAAKTLSSAKPMSLIKALGGKGSIFASAVLSALPLLGMGVKRSLFSGYTPHRLRGGSSAFNKISNLNLSGGNMIKSANYDPNTANASLFNMFKLLSDRYGVNINRVSELYDAGNLQQSMTNIQQQASKNLKGNMKNVAIGAGVLGTMYLGKKLYDYMSKSKMLGHAEQNYPEMYERYQFHQRGNDYTTPMEKVACEGGLVLKVKVGGALANILGGAAVALGTMAVPAVIGAATQTSAPDDSVVMETSMNLLQFDPTLDEIPRKTIFDLVKSISQHSPSLLQDLAALSQAVKAAHYYGGMGPQMVQSLVKIEEGKGKGQVGTKPTMDALSMMSSISNIAG